MLVFELDGGSWDVMTPLLEQGRLPNIARLVGRGASGSLESIPPLLSPALWTTIYTGLPRDQHGVMTFDARSLDVKASRLWDVAAAHGMDCGVCGSMVTWPPYDVGAFMIPDIMARDAQTVPPELAPIQELVVKYPSRGRENAGYSMTAYPVYALRLLRQGVRLSTVWALMREVAAGVLRRRDSRESFWRRALLLQDIYADVSLRLYGELKPQLLTYHCHSVDTLSHWYWRSGGDSQREVAFAYEAADRVLGRFLDVLGAKTHVLLLSDHGFQTNPEERPRYKARLRNWVTVLGLEATAIPTRLAHQHFLYFRDASLVGEVSTRLRDAYFKEAGEPVLPRVVERDSSIVFPPPLHPIDGQTAVIPGIGEFAAEYLFENTGQVETGIHHRVGVVVLAGPGVLPGVRLEAPSILDVMPTALTLLGLPLASDMTGRVWHEALDPGQSQFAEIEMVDTYLRAQAGRATNELVGTERDQLYERLESLGYL